MGDRKFKNNANSTLASGIGSGDTILDVATGEGADFPALSGSEFFMCTLEGAGLTEIVKVTARATDQFTIVRAQEGTTAQVFGAGATVEQRNTADSQEKTAYVDQVNTFTARQEFAKGTDVASAATLPLPAGNFGDATGTVDVTAIATAPAGTQIGYRFTGAGLTLTHNGTSLILAYGVDEVVGNGDVFEFVSLGSGNWLEAARLRAGSANRGLKNKLVNGGFDLWQRGTSFTATGYTADRWRSFLGTGGAPAATISRQAHTVGQTDVPDEPQYFLRHDQTALASSTRPSEEQRIESVRILAGQTAIVSFYAKASKAITVRSSLTQHFGTGGAPSSDVADIGGTDHSITTSWKRFTNKITVTSISGKTIGTAGNDYLKLIFELPLSDTYQFDVSHVQIEAGNAATAFENRPLSDELALAQRYYTKTFEQGTAPAQSVGTPNVLVTIADDAGDFVISWAYPVLMRASPTITTYNPNVANDSARNDNDSTDTAVSSTAADRQVFFAATSIDATDAHDQMRVHVSADAEL